MQRAAAALALCVALLLSSAQAQAPLSNYVDGTAVPFGGPADGVDPHAASGGLSQGSCGYGLLDQQQWPFWVVAAVSPAFFLAANSTRHPALGCGGCLEIQCTGSSCPVNANTSSLIALVTDTCNSCEPNKLTLHYLAFQQKLANPDLGAVNIRYRQVECTPPGTIQLAIDTYRATEGGYIRLSLSNVAGSGAFQAVELRKSPLAGDRLSLTGTWQKMKNSWGAMWEASGLPDTPLDLRITSDGGQVVLARQAITQAGVTGKLTLPVQFGTSVSAGVADALTNATIAAAPEASCNTTIMSFLRTRPDLSTLVQHLEEAGAAPLLEDPSATVTLFAPTNAAWSQVNSAVVDLSDKETLQNVLTFLIAQGQVKLPDTSVMLPEDLAAGGISVSVETINGLPLQIFAGMDGIAVRDGSSLTPDSVIAEVNKMVCSSVVNVISAVPMPFP